MLLAEPVEIPTFERTPDIRLIATDMDGTLLDDDKRLNAEFWPLLEELDRRGVLFCPASGRQYTTLLREFENVADDMVFIAENGSMVMRGGQEISSACLPREEIENLVLALRRAIAGGVDAGAVVCGKRSAYVERSDAAFIDQVGRYNAKLEIVADLLDVVDHDEILKIAVFDFGSAEHSTLPRGRTPHRCPQHHRDRRPLAGRQRPERQQGGGGQRAAGGLRHHAGADHGLR